MNPKSKGFMLYYDDLDILEDLTDEQLGTLIRALRDDGKKVPPELMTAFRLMKKKKERDEAKYLEYVESRRQNRTKRNAPPEAHIKTYDDISEHMILCDDISPLKVKVKEKVKVNIKEKKKEKKEPRLPALAYDQRTDSLDYLYTDLGGSSE